MFMTKKKDTINNDLLQEIIRDAWLNIHFNEKTLYNPLERFPADFENNPHMYILWLIQQPEYFSFLCSEIMNVRILPMQAVVLNELWHRRFPMLIGHRGWGKSFILALYTLLRILLLPSRRVVICGAAFRQSKVIFNYMESIWHNAPLLRDLCGNYAGPKHEPDMYRFLIGDSVALALPIGTGEKIRGQRANDIIADEFAATSRDVFENVIAGFGVVKSSPVDSVQDRAANDFIKRLNIPLASFENNRQNNQMILSGTAYYDFNHFATYWKRWKTIIRSRGNIEKLSSVFGDEEIPENFNWKDFSIIRIPVELAPKGFMDDAMIARSKATVHSGIYEMEFGACVKDNTEIITTTGCKKIKNIVIGDKVLTHTGSFKKVTRLYRKPYKNKIIELDMFGYNRKIQVTPEHPFLTPDLNFNPIKNIIDKTYTPNLQQLNNIKKIDVSDCQKTKEHIPTFIKLDYNFGLCVGYYASKGNIGSGGHCVEFALDEQVNRSLQFFVAQLKTALFDTFGIKAKEYRKKHGTISININSKLVVSLFKKICPGVCYNKVIDPKILFSNSEFIKGFIVGFWNGDGHINNQCATCETCNKNLLVQLKLCLSYFAMGCSLLLVNKSPAYKLNISGTDYRNFKSVFYNEDSNIYNKRDKIFNNGAFTEQKIKDKKLVDFNGFVYNLEVEDDHSYCTFGGCVHNCFSTDSNGFFKRSLIESCVISHDNEIFLPNGQVNFTAKLKGDHDKKYIYGIDPASEVDNFSIVILEHYSNHRRIVYVWTTTRAEHRERIKAGLATETDFYSYCARKIRELMRVFPCERIALDAQGGGISIMEALHDKDKIQKDELPIWPIIIPGKPMDTDGEPGLHILEMIQFASASWTSEANHGLRKDFEDKVCIFPRFDKLTLGFAELVDDFADRLYDTLEGCLLEIEELKNELSTIVITQSLNGRDRWDTPEIKLPGNKKGRLRKDRYSALLMANMVSRQLARNPELFFQTEIGGFAGRGKYDSGNDRMYIGASWICDRLDGIYD
jgi:hypothetical protein